MNDNDVALIGLDPLFNVDVKLFIKDIYRLRMLETLKGFYRLYQHYIQNVEICGCVVAFERKGVSDIYTVDDGTGTIECILEADSLLQLDPVVLGDCIRVSGKINDYRDNRELRVHALAAMGPNDELMHNVQVMWLKKEYQKHFEIPLEYKSKQREIEKQLNEEEISIGLVMVSDSQDVKKDTAAFCDALLKHLKTRYQGNSVFSATAPTSDETLKSLAKEAIMNSEFNANPSVKHLSQFFYHNLKVLETKGYIIQTDQKGSLFRLVDQDKLKNTVLQIIQEMLNSKDNYIGGVLEEYIVARIQNEEGYAQFPSIRILKLLEEMASNSVIYTCASGEYKIL